MAHFEEIKVHGSKKVFTKVITLL